MNALARSVLPALALFAVLVVARPAHAQDSTPSDGMARATADRGFEVFDAERARWVDPLAFWLAYSARRDGPTWGRGAEYPPYDQVREFDTFLVEVAQGPCLMEFFHTRWRRANDVRRWNEQFNSFGGCATVFD